MERICAHCGTAFEGPPQARFCSDAHRKAHARAGEVGQRSTVAAAEVGQEKAVEVGQSLPAAEEVGQVEVAQGPARRVPLVSLERYVSDALDAALAYSKSIGESDAPYTVAEGIVLTNRRRDRLERAKRYAEWRYGGFVDGSIASL